MWSAAKKTLGPAFGTYVAGALPIAGGALGAKLLYDYAKRHEHKKHAAATSAVMPAPFRSGFEKSAVTKDQLKAFGIGAAMVGIPVAGAMYYNLKNKAARENAAVSEELYRRQLDAQGTPPAVRDLLMRGRKNVSDWQLEHPVATTALVSGLAGAAVGGLTAWQMEDMD
jgi:hypothetical protein